MHRLDGFFAGYFLIGGISANLDLLGPCDLSVLADVHCSKISFVLKRAEDSLAYFTGKINHALRSISVGNPQPIFRQRLNSNRPDHNSIIIRVEALSNNIHPAEGIRAIRGKLFLRLTRLRDSSPPTRARPALVPA